MWFRNLYLFKLENPFNFSAEDLQALMEKNQLDACPPGQRETLGWVSPFGRNNELLVLANQGFYLIRMARAGTYSPGQCD